MVSPGVENDGDDTKTDDDQDKQKESSPDDVNNKEGVLGLNDLGEGRPKHASRGGVRRRQYRKKKGDAAGLGDQTSHDRSGKEEDTKSLEQSDDDDDEPRRGSLYHRTENSLDLDRHDDEHDDKFSKSDLSLSGDEFYCDYDDE